MNVRKLNGPLTHHQVGAILHLWHAAAKAGLALTAHITQRLAHVDRLTPAERMKILQATLNAYSTSARRYGFVPAFLWTREIGPDGRGEHFHILVHVPPRLFAALRKSAEARRPFPEIMVTRARRYIRQLPDGRWLTSATYIAKQMTPQARYKYRLPRKSGGKVTGTRMGMSRNIKALLKG